MLYLDFSTLLVFILLSTVPCFSAPQPWLPRPAWIQYPTVDEPMRYRLDEILKDEMSYLAASWIAQLDESQMLQGSFHQDYYMPHILLRYKKYTLRMIFINRRSEDYNGPLPAQGPRGIVISTGDPDLKSQAPDPVDRRLEDWVEQRIRDNVMEGALRLRNAASIRPMGWIDRKEFGRGNNEFQLSFAIYPPGQVPTIDHNLVPRVDLFDPMQPEPPQTRRRIQEPGAQLEPLAPPSTTQPEEPEPEKMEPDEPEPDEPEPDEPEPDEPEPDEPEPDEPEPDEPEPDEPEPDEPEPDEPEPEKPEPEKPEQEEMELSRRSRSRRHHERART
ncbi:MAG: hypothetical protein M1837_002441 [Sclerophora amabilis]|nr:MAG: hypothetical protein M1837_002441 [Sclerophora amabilis]